MKHTLALVLMVFGIVGSSTPVNAHDPNEIGLKCTFEKNRVFYEEDSPDITVILNKKDKHLFTSSLKSASEFLNYSDEQPTYYSASVEQQYGVFDGLIEYEYLSIDKVSLRLVHTYDVRPVDGKTWYEDMNKDFRAMISLTRYEKVYQCEVMEII